LGKLELTISFSKIAGLINYTSITKKLTIILKDKQFSGYGVS